MHGKLLHELEVELAASKVWEIYGTLKLAEMVVQILPDVLQKIEIEGDGGVGTTLSLTFPPGTPGLSSYKERFVAIDNEKRVKVTDVVEGGYLDHGFTSYRVIFEVVEKDIGTSSLIRSVIEYEVDDQHASHASLVTIKPLEIIAQTVVNHLLIKEGEAGV